MNEEELFLEKEYLRHLNIITDDENGTENIIGIDVSRDKASDKLLDAQDLVLQRIPEGKTKSLTISSDKDEIAHIDLSPLNELKSNIEQLQAKISKLDQIKENFESVDRLTNTYNQTNKIYEEKLQHIETLINQKFGLIDNTINKQKATESPLKKQGFQKLSTSYSKEIKELFKKSYKKVFQGKSTKSAAEQQSMNNALSRKIKLKENLLKEFKNTRATANPEQMAEKLLLDIFRPIKAVGNALHQYASENKEIKERTPMKSVEDTPNGVSDALMSVEGKKYAFKGYSKDYSKIILKDATGKHFQTDNNQNRKLEFNGQIKLNPIQKDLLNMGKSLLMSDRNYPYKISKNADNDITITTIKVSELTAGKKQSSNQSKSKSQSV